MSIKNIPEIPSHVNIQPLLEADKTRNLHKIHKHILEMVAQHHLTLQQIEKIFRDNKCFTYLIARERGKDYAANVKFLSPDNPSVEKTYNLWISTRDKEIALQELLLESKSYEDNFTKLNDTGFATLSEDHSISSQVQKGYIEVADKKDPNLRVVFDVRLLKDIWLKKFSES